MAGLKKVHNKLVRDNIPTILKQNNIAYEIEILDQDRFERLLLDKLEEEAQEAAVSLDEDLLEELADIESLIDAILELKGWNRESLKTMQIEKDDKAGVFEKRIFLKSTIDNALDDSEKDDEEEEENE
jgi:predicted house-cleaning noncanonical NTP pyrophosphatase (MazG superfamily)